MSDLAYRLSSYIKAVETLKKAQDNCQYDAGYYLQRERDDVNNTEKAFLDELLERLDAREAERRSNDPE